MVETERKPSLESDGSSGGGVIYYGWVLVGACFVVISLVSILMASFPVFYPAVMEEFGWGRAETAIAMSLHLVLGGLASPVAGGLIDRYGPRVVMPLGAIVTAISLLWLSRVSELWQFYLAFGVVAAVGSSMLHVVPLTAVISNWFVRNRGTAIGVVTAGSGMGQLVLLPAIQYLISGVGWRMAYLLLGATILVVPTTLILKFLHSSPESRGVSIEGENRRRRSRRRGEVIVEVGGEEVERKPAIVSRKEVVVLDRDWVETDWTIASAMRRFRFWAVTVVIAMFAAGFFLISVQLVKYLTGSGFSEMVAASVMGLQGGVNVGGKFLGGLLCDRIGREKTLTLSVGIFLACIVLLNLAGGVGSVALVYAFAVTYGLGYGMALPALMASAADLFEGKHFGAILGVMILIGYVGGAVGAWLGGHLYEATNGYVMNFVVAGGAMVVSALLIWWARPSRVRLVRAV